MAGRADGLMSANGVVQLKQSGLTRRRVVGLSMGSYLAASLPLTGAWAMSGVSVPPSPMRLTRVLHRSLRDGNAVVVERSWKVRFASQARGYAVSGEQVAVSVKTPPSLATLAGIEESRSTAEMFPILLSPDGAIMAAGPATSAQSLAKAVREADAIIAQHKLGDSAKEDYRRFVAELEKAGGSMLEQMPSDLFFPSTEPMREVRKVMLESGVEGEFELGWEASVQSGTQWLSSARREVITRIGQSERISWESWALASA